MIFTGRLTYEDLLELHRQRWYGLLFRWSYHYLFFFAFAFACLLYAHDHGDYTPEIFICGGLAGFFPFLWRFYYCLSERFRLRRQKGKVLDVATATISSESVRLSDETSEGRLAWERIAAVIDTPRGISFLIPPQRVWFYLPNHLFQDTSYRADILALARANKVRVIRRR